MHASRANLATVRRGGVLGLLLLLGASADAAAPPGEWWHPAWQARRQLLVKTGSRPVPAGYSYRVVFDHAAVVAAGLGAGGGAPVRIVRWTGSGWEELDRVLDPGSGWQRPDTTLWFRSPLAYPASTADSDFYLYYGNPNASVAPENPSRVFLFFDDFEGPPLEKWASFGRAALWQVSSVAHRGSASLYYPPDPPDGGSLVASPPINEADVMVESYWRVIGVGRVDVSQFARFDPPFRAAYGANLEFSGGWNLYEVRPSDGNFVELAPNRGAPTEGVWTRVSYAIAGTQAVLFQDGVQINPLAGRLDVGMDLLTGNVGLSKYWVSPDAGFWVDDFLARRYVDPEPTTSLEPEEQKAASSDGGTGGSPRFVSTPTLGLTCGEAWSYDPKVEGATNLRFSIRGAGRSPLPDGLSVDPATGHLQWTPAQTDAGRWLIDLIADSDQGSINQPVDLVVDCTPWAMRTGCGCASAPLLPEALLLGALGWLRWRRRRNAPRQREVRR